METKFIQGSHNIPVLSILICSLEERRDVFLERLLKLLLPQIQYKDVEVVILTDNGEVTIGSKRNLAMEIAAGKYLCFMDDDDLISEDYVDLILEKIEEDSDVIAITAIRTGDGENLKIVKYGIEYDHGETPDAYYRRPNHLCVHKKENIGQKFLDVRTGEDDEWAARRLIEIKSQSKIEKVIYHYDYRSTTKKYFSEPFKSVINPTDSLIEISVVRPDPNNLEGSIKVHVIEPDFFNQFFSFPLHFTVTNIFGRSVWETSLTPGWFSQWPWLTWTKSTLTDSAGNRIWSWEWDPLRDGCVCHQIFHLWSLKHRGAFGIAIGTHDGTAGEWVGPVNRGILKALLVEASETNFRLLEQNYSGKGWIKIENRLITESGGEKIFHEGGSGHTNSVLKSHIQMTVNDSDISERLQNSESLVSLLERNPGTRWLHIDVEGIDDELILSIGDRDDLLPDLIVYEHESLSPEKENILWSFLSSKKFTIYKGKSRNSIAIR